MDAPCNSGKTILLVDDEPQVRRMLKVCLESAGFGVIEAEGGLKALEIVEQMGSGAVDLLVTDIEMPDMDGITLAERCKRRVPDLPVVAISAFTGKALAAVGSWVDAFIQKPFAPRVLLETVAKVLRKSSS